MKLEASRTKSIFLLLAAAALWSLGGFLVKFVQWNPLAISGARSVIAALVMLAVIGRPRLPKSLPQIIGALAYSATVILFVVANKLTTAANAILFQYTSPIYVVLLGAIFLKERVYKRDLAMVAVVLGGMVLFFMDDLQAGNLAGNLLALASGITCAASVICLRLRKSALPVENVFYGNVITAVIGLPFIFRGPFPDVSGWAAIIFMGIFQLGLSYTIYAIAIKKVTALEAVLIPIIEPILNPIIVMLTLKEIPGRWSIAGGAIVLAAVTIKCVLSLKRPPNEA